MALAAGIANMFRIQELRKRILFTITLLFIYRIGIGITTPGVDRIAMHELMGKGAGFLGLAPQRAKASRGGREQFTPPLGETVPPGCASPAVIPVTSVSHRDSCAAVRQGRPVGVGRRRACEL